MTYQQFAHVYDHLMKDAPYDLWLQFVHRVCQKHHHPIKKVMDLACGTGAISIPLAREGLEVIGIDMSADMLSMAQHKGREQGVSIHWLEQDMTMLELPFQVDTALCFCDSLNYVIEEDLLKQTFQRVYNHISCNGLFLFDCHSLYQLKEIFGDNTFGINDEEISYVWQCDYDEEAQSATHELSFFIQEEGNQYRRFDEVHKQQGYPLDKLKIWLKECGFKVLEVTADFSEEAPHDKSHRWFIVAQKK